MQELVLKPRSEIKVIYGDAFYMIRKPNLGRLAQFDDELNEAKNKSAKAAYDVMASFLEDLGLPKEVVLELDGDALEEITKALSSKKKP